MIKIICVGKLKETYLQEALQEYQKRLQRYTKLEIIEVIDMPYQDIEKVKAKEAENIQKYIKEKDYIIILDIDGKEFDSCQLATKLQELNTHYANLTFIIGGSYGLSDTIKQQASLRLSFSKLTFPHQLFRVMLLEQLYRCYKIQNHESYHK